MRRETGVSEFAGEEEGAKRYCHRAVEGIPTSHTTSVSRACVRHEGKGGPAALQSVKNSESYLHSDDVNQIGVALYRAAGSGATPLARIAIIVGLVPYPKAMHTDRTEAYVMWLHIVPQGTEAFGRTSTRPSA